MHQHIHLNKELCTADTRRGETEGLVGSGGEEGAGQLMFPGPYVFLFRISSVRIG